MEIKDITAFLWMGVVFGTIIYILVHDIRAGDQGGSDEGGQFRKLRPYE